MLSFYFMKCREEVRLRVFALCAAAPTTTATAKTVVREPDSTLPDEGGGRREESELRGRHSLPGVS